MDKINLLQRSDPEKLTELCHMHLTFELDLHDEELSALRELQCQPKNKKCYFSRRHKDKPLLNGLSLNAESVGQVYRIMDFLGKDSNVCNEGLFRKTGSLSRQQELKAVLYSGSTIDLGGGRFNVHDLASVLKGFLAELPEPLLTEAHYSAHNQVSLMQEEEAVSLDKNHPIYLRQLKSTRLLFLLLPMDNYSLLKHLLLLLKKVTTDKGNRMTATSLATLFAPHILCPRKMPAEELKKKFSCMVKSVAFMIENANELFEPPFELVRDVVMHLEDMSSKAVVHTSRSKNDAVKTMIAFCDRTKNGDEASVDYTNKALSELQSYIQNLPNSARKRKLIKKFQKENVSENDVQPKRRHYRSRSVGEVIKKHLLRSSGKRKDNCREYHHSSCDMLASRSESAEVNKFKGKCRSEEALMKGCDTKSTQSINKLPYLGKNLFRASKKIKIQRPGKFGETSSFSESALS